MDLDPPKLQVMRLQAADAGVLIEVRNDKPAQIPLALRPEISDISMQITRSPVDPLLSTSVAGSPSSSTVQAAQQEIDTEQYSPCLTMLLGQSLKVSQLHVEACYAASCRMLLP